MQNRHDVFADRHDFPVRVHRTMNALDRRAAKARNVMQFRANRTQPVNRSGALLGQLLHKGRVIETMPADKGVKLEQLDGIKVAIGTALVRVPLFGDRSRKSLNGGVAGVIVGFRGLQLLFHARRFVKGVAVLIDRLRGVHAARGTDGVSAHHGHTLHHNDIASGVGGDNGGNHARAARADNDYIRVINNVLDGLRFFGRVQQDRGGLERGGGHSGALQGVADCVLDSVGSDGCARHAVHL